VRQDEMHNVPVSLEFEEIEVDPKIRGLKTQIGDLENELTNMRKKLEASKEDKERNYLLEDNLDQLLKEMQEMREKNLFLSNHNKALVSEMQESHAEVDSLKDKVKQHEKVIGNIEKRKSETLGQKNFLHLGPDAITKTKSAYKKKFVEDVNNYGETRGLVVDKIILRDKDGVSDERLEINAERANTFQNLTPGERKAVQKASRWKDRHRISDKCYSELAKVASLPKASHVKQHEGELNQQIGQIHQV
jgi:outer membrane murein-binding lipoprotein Lpp